MGKKNHDWICAALGKAIKARRAELQMSQEELSERSGIWRTYLTDVEGGKRNISVKNLDRLADALEMPPSLLLSAAEDYRRRKPRQ